MDGLQQLYQEVIIDHNRSPRNYHVMEEADCSADGFNPLCGDKLSLYLKLSDDDIIEQASFVGQGCAISTASASLMTEFLRGKTFAEAQAMFADFHDAVTKKDLDAEKRLGKLQVLTGVKQFPARVKCATLAWHTLRQALKNSEEIASTE